MKILPSKIKRWSFKQRLHEIQKRMRIIQTEYTRSYKNHIVYSETLADALSESLQIVDYWMDHMAGEVENTKEKKVKKKHVNLWE